MLGRKIMGGIAAMSIGAAIAVATTHAQASPNIAPVGVYSATVYGGCPVLESIESQAANGTLTLGGYRVAILKVESTTFSGCFVTIPIKKR